MGGCVSSFGDRYWLSEVEGAGDDCRKVLRDAPDYIRNNRNIVIAAVNINGLALEFASPSLRNDKDIVMAAVKNWGIALEYASPQLQDDETIVLAAVQKDGYAFEKASPNQQNNKVVAMAAVQERGYVLKYASPSLRNDKQVVLTAVKQYPDAIKFAGRDDLKRDRDVLIASGMYDAVHDDATVREQKRSNNTNSAKIVLSTRFSLNETSESEATNFTAKFKECMLSRNVTVYAPNAFNKKTCDPEWTRFDWPCRGTNDTCQYCNVLTDDGHPTDNCCWRYSFRSQLTEAKATSGFMLQLVETGEKYGKGRDATLGNGQAIELDMANTMGAKVFQVYRPEGDEDDEYPFGDRHIDLITEIISQWHDNQCQDMSVSVIRQPLSFVDLFD